MPVAFGYSKFGIDRFVEVSSHPAFIIERVIERDRPPLPVEAIVHVKHVDMTQADLLLIHDPDEIGILLRWTAGKDPTRRSILAIVRPYLFRHLSSYPLVDVVRHWQDPDPHSGVRVVLQLIGRNAAPGEQGVWIDARRHIVAPYTVSGHEAA